MLSRKRKLSQVEEDGLVAGRQSQPRTWTNICQRCEAGSCGLYNHGRQPQNDENRDHSSRMTAPAFNGTMSESDEEVLVQPLQHQLLPASYDQRFSNAPIINGDIDGNVITDLHISTLDVSGLQLLYQHAAMGAMHESNERYPPPLCHPGTREVVVVRIIGWHLDSNRGKKRVMWVHAPAGYGKTAVAGTVTEKLKAMRRELGFTPVGATFFFWRTSPQRSSPTRLIITLACQLAQSIPDLRPRIEAVVKSEPDVIEMALEIQLEKLIVEPFECLPGYDAMPNRLIIVDGVDECINWDLESRVERKYAEQQEVVQIRVLDIIHSLHSHHLPLSFLILSRPEAWIKRHLESSRFQEVLEPLDLQEVGDHMNDVKRFVRAELSRIATSFGLEGVDEEWPEEEWLVCQSDGHILYAATVIRHIDDPYGDPRQLLKDIIDNSERSPAFSHSTPLSSLHELYRQIMRSCPERNRTLMLEVLEDVVAFRMRNHVRKLPCGMAFDFLDRLARRSPGSGIKALRPLHAVMRFGNMDEAIYNLFIHSSFTEFLLTPLTSMEFSVDRGRGEERLLAHMLNCMGSVTMDVIIEQPEEHILFALNNWCHLWSRLSNGRFQESRSSHIQMIQKVLALDLPACLIRPYLSIGDSQKRNRYESPFWRLFSSPTPSNFLVETMESESTDSERGPFIHTVISHTQSSLEAAFITLLRATDLSDCSPNATWLMACDCVDYLKEVVTRAGWRGNGLVQELRNPRPNGLDLFIDIFQQYTPQDLKRYVYMSLVRNRNPIVDREEHPFQDLVGVEETDAALSDEGGELVA